MQPFELPDFYVPWPARMNPNLDAAREYSKKWAQEVGILNAPSSSGSPSIWSEQSFDKHDYALFCAYIHPEAPVIELNLMTAWNVWAFYVDDFFLQVYKRPKDHDGAKQYLDRVLLFMPVDLSPTPEPTNPMERGLINLWARTASTKSAAWRQRINESMRNLLEAFLWELDSMSQHRIANPMEYIEMRRQVGAALWSADLVEHAMSVEIPERIAKTRPIKVIKDTFADAVHLRNDIFSYQREVLRDGELTNAILVVERFLGGDTQHAVNIVNDLLTSRLQQFEHTVITELAQIFQEYALTPIEQSNVLTYIRGLQDWQSGAHEWHIQTSRYLNPSFKVKQTPTDVNLLLTIKGLGIAATQISAGTLGANRLKNYIHTPFEKIGPVNLPEFYMPFRAEMNPHLETAQKHEKIWARQMGMLDVLPGQPGLFIWDEYRFDVTDLAFFSALAHPNATEAQLDLAAYGVVWGTYTDDYFFTIYGRTHDLAGAKIFHARLSEFMPIEQGVLQPTPTTPVEKGLADLWLRSTKVMTIDELRSYRKVVEDVIGSWVWELSNQIQHRIPDLIDYMEMRRTTCGTGIMLALPRSVHGQNIPPEVHNTLTMQQLNHAAFDYACLTNDIFSYQKEIQFEGSINNAVFVIQNFLNCDHVKAIEIANNLMTARMQQFERIKATELPILFDNFNMNTHAREQLLAYTQELQNYVYGSLEWHIKTDRYREVEFERSLRAFTGRATGLGTMTTRILSIIGESGNTTTSQSIATPSNVQESPLPIENVKPFAISHLEPSFIKEKRGGVTGPTYS